MTYIIAYIRDASLGNIPILIKVSTNREFNSTPKTLSL